MSAFPATALTGASGAISHRAALAVAGALAAAMALSPIGGTPAAAEQVTGPLSEQVTYLVRTAPGAAGSVADAAGRTGVVVERTLRALDAVVIKATPGQAARLGSATGVEGVTPDAPMRANNYDAAADGTSLHNVQQSVGARTPWKSGVTGAGIDVAVIDSGVNRVAGLNAPGKVIYSPDFTPEAASSTTANVDGYGHGTHMAGIIAGQDPVDPEWNTDKQAFYGVAPRARIVSVKVADASGNTTIAAVMSGLDWVVQNRWTNGRNIQVANLSFGTDSAQDYRTDPLAHATETAWKKGLTVVVSAGNDGTTLGRLDNPAKDPYVISVGASDTRGTLSTGDDTVAGFSSRGDGVRNPDVVAPGRGIQSLRVPGSYVDVNYGSTGTLGTRYFRGSGTSQATAFVSGAAALMVQGRQWRTDTIKAALMSTATPLWGYDVKAQGRGQVNVDKAYHSAPSGASQNWASSTGTGSLDAAGDVDVSARSWKARSWKGDSWAWNLS